MNLKLNYITNNMIELLLFIINILIFEKKIFKIIYLTKTDKYILYKDI